MIQETNILNNPWFILSITFLYATIVSLLYSQIRKNFPRNHLYRGIINIVKDNMTDINASYIRLELFFSTYIRKHPLVNQYYISLNEAINHLITDIQLLDDTPELVNRQYKINVDELQIVLNRLYELSDVIQNNDKYSNISGETAHILQVMEECYNNQNHAQGVQMYRETMRQLSKNIESKEEQLKRYEKQGKINTIVSVVGILLTLFFGFLSVFQLLR